MVDEVSSMASTLARSQVKNVHETSGRTARDPQALQSQWV